MNGGGGAASERLLPEGRLAGPMPWVIAIMMFLTALAAGAGIGLSGATRDLGRNLEGGATVQLVEPNPAAREIQAEAAVAELRRLSAVRQAERVPDARVAEMLAPWLGPEGLDDQLARPALIDVALKDSGPRAIAQLKEALDKVAPSVRVDRNADWLAPLVRLLNSLETLALALVALMFGAMVAAVVLAARGALNTHRQTIDVLHLLGADDAQIARLFQRRIALDVFYAGIGGLVLALATMLLVGDRLRALGSGLFGTAGLGLWGWLAVLSVPLVGAAIAALAARATIVLAMRRTL